jgi:hypothetical protein
MSKLSAPAGGLLIPAFDLIVHPSIDLRRIRNDPAVFACQFARLVSIHIEIASVDREIDVMLFFVFITVKNANTVSANFWLPVEPIILQRIAHFLLYLLRGQLDAVLVHKLFSPEDETIIDIVLFTDEAGLNHCPHRERSLRFEARLADRNALDKTGQAGNQPITIGFSMTQ